MPKASELSPDQRFVGLFVGRSGSGKTVAECSFPGPIDVLDFDGRIRGLLGAPWIDRSRINYEYFPPKGENVVDKLNKKLDYYQTAARAGQPLPETLVLDSLTSECFAMVQQALGLTHTLGDKNTKKVGKYLGQVAMAGPEDYGFEAQATYDIISFMRSVPIKNIIVSAHIVEKYGKLDPDNPYADSVPIGEKLSVRDKIGENIQIYFDHIFRFDRRELNGRINFFVKFRSDIARTSYNQLPDGEVDITGVSFYDKLMQYVKTTDEAAA
jgi:hypothetical protein